MGGWSAPRAFVVGPLVFDVMALQLRPLRLLTRPVFSLSSRLVGTFVTAAVSVRPGMVGSCRPYRASPAPRTLGSGS